MGFEIYGGGIAPTDKQYSRRWLSIGNEEVWWEQTSGTMGEITAANGTISTVNPLTIAEAYQKVFIANRLILKVIDFGTTRLGTSQIGAASASVPARKAVLSGSSSGAGMVCDFVTAATGSAEVYGYAIDSVAFTTADTVVDVDSTTSVSFAIISGGVAYASATPHVYDWTPYANDTTTYGSMPTH
jgi:hypothetical protein